MPRKRFKTTPRANKKSPARVKAVLAAIAGGHTQGEACAIADVSSKAWQNWIREDSAKPARPETWNEGDPEPEGGYREDLATLQSEAIDEANAFLLDVHHRAATGQIEGVETIRRTETRLRKAVHVDQHSGQLFEAEEPYEHVETSEKISAKIDLRGIEWELERRNRTDYSPPQKVEVTGAGGGAVELAIGFDQQLSKLYGEVAAKEAMKTIAGGDE